MRVWWMIFIEEGQFLLHWLYIGVHMIVQHVLDMQALTFDEEWENTKVGRVYGEEPGYHLE